MSTRCQAAAFLALSFFARSSQAAEPDQVVPMSVIQEAVDEVEPTVRLPLEATDDLAYRVNKFLGSPEGRRHVRDSLARASAYADVVNYELDIRGIPAEFAMIPVVESSYRNDGRWAYPDPATERPRGAGLWMLIPNTARSHGLTVSADRDDRLNVRRSTGVALDYLVYLNRRYEDWGLALAAYNRGEGAVARSVRREETRDVWELMEDDSLNDYVAAVAAIILIKRSPTLRAWLVGPYEKKFGLAVQ